MSRAFVALLLVCSLALTLAPKRVAAATDASAASGCDASYDVYAKGEASLASCGVGTYPLLATTGLPDGGRSFHYLASEPQSLPPAVIGEGMAKRVNPYAEQNGYVTYKGLDNSEAYTKEELLAHNQAQIDAWKTEGRPIIDIGPAPGRAFYPFATSPNYAMEQNMVAGYDGLQRVVLPGEEPWMEYAGGY